MDRWALGGEPWILSTAFHLTDRDTALRCAYAASGQGAEENMSINVSTTTCTYGNPVCLQKTGAIQMPCDSNSITMAFATSSCVTVEDVATTTSNTISSSAYAASTTATSTPPTFLDTFTAGDVFVGFLLLALIAIQFGKAIIKSIV